LFIFAIDFHILKISAKNTATATLPLLREPGEIIALSKEKKGGAIWQFVVRIFEPKNKTKNPTLRGF
jgi:hypothetical protein